MLTPPRSRASAFAALDAVGADLLVQIGALDAERDRRLRNVPLRVFQRVDDVAPLRGLAM